MDRNDILRLFDTEAARLRAWLWRETGDREIATDLTAETFAQALVSMRRHRGGDQRAWLYGIARNLLLRHRRHAQVERRARTKLGMPDRHWDEYDVGSPLDELPEHEREALSLHVLDGLPYDEVAERLDISAGAARMRVHRALQRLKGTAT